LAAYARSDSIRGTSASCWAWRVYGPCLRGVEAATAALRPTARLPTSPEGQQPASVEYECRRARSAPGTPAAGAARENSFRRHRVTAPLVRHRLRERVDHCRELDSFSAPCSCAQARAPTMVPASESQKRGGLVSRELRRFSGIFCVLSRCLSSISYPRSS